MKLHLWLSSVNGSEGGIQTYNQFFLKALLGAGINAECWIKNDIEKYVPGEYQVNYFGKWPMPLRTYVFGFFILFGAFFKKPDYVVCGHIHFIPVARLLKKICNIPYIVIVHGIEAWNLSFCQKKGLRKAMCVLPVSVFTQKKIQEQTSLEDSRFFVLHNTADMNRFQPGPHARNQLMQRLQLNQQTKILLSVGRLSASEKYKGHDLVLNTLPAVLKKYPDLKYVVVGTGDDRERLQKMVSDLDVANHVIFSGKVSDLDLPLYYQACDVFVLPSRGEGFGIVYLEALFCGKPVIASNADAAQEVLVGGELGRLVPSGNIEKLAEAILAALDENLPAEEIRKRALIKYGPQAFEKRLKEFIQSHLKVTCAA